MIFISHRGNYAGPRRHNENKPDYILQALDHGFHVEIDAWLIDNKFFLGHDEPQYEVNLSFLRNDKFWVHCKNVQAFIKLSSIPDVNCFFQEDDYVTLTSKGFLWHHSNCKRYGEKSILTRIDKPKENNPIKAEFSDLLVKPYGICSDFIAYYSADSTNKSSLKPNLPFELLICDIDGVLSHSKAYDLDGNVLFKSWCDADFTAIKRLKSSGIKVCFLSGDLRVNENMAKKRKIDFFHCHRDMDKVDFLPTLREKYQTNKIAYVGDDYFDIALMNSVTMSFCPSNSPRRVRQSATHVVPVESGKGVIAGILDIVEDQIPLAYPKDFRNA